MYVGLVLALTVLCAVISRSTSARSYQDGRPYMMPGYIRIKRGKYYSSPPQRFYSKPPTGYPSRAVFSYTPPPNYMADDDDPSYPGIPIPPKVSKKPTYEGLGDDDINSIIKNLSKKDLEKIIEFAGVKDKDTDKYPKDLFEQLIKDSSTTEDSKTRYSSRERDLEKYPPKVLTDDESKLFKALVQEIDTDPDYTPKPEPKPFSIKYHNKPNKPVNYVTPVTPSHSFYADPQNSDVYDLTALKTEEAMLQNQIAYLKSQINDGVVYTDSKLIPEENLPKPMNLREEQDFDASYTNNVATVVNAQQGSSYKLEDFSSLPLMNYNSKLDTRSSYHVPHYAVTSSSKQSSSYSRPIPPYGPSSSHIKVPTVEPAPPPSAAKAQSDAHLKAVKIWSHKSKGTAYTLHDDGSLSLEKPGRPKGSYGYQ